MTQVFLQRGLKSHKCGQIFDNFRCFQVNMDNTPNQIHNTLQLTIGVNFRKEQSQFLGLVPRFEPHRILATNRV